MKGKGIIFAGIMIFHQLSSSTAMASSECGCQFLLTYPGARQSGMGETFTGIANDAMATYYNDAGMAFQKYPDVEFTHFNLLPGLYPSMYYSFLGYVQPTKIGAFGGQIIYLTTGNTEGISEYGQKIGKWTTWDAAIKISYAKKLNKKIGIGLGVKYLYSFILPPTGVLQRQPYDVNLYGGSGTTIGFDFSSLYTPSNQVSIGVSVQNLGHDITYITAGLGDPLPYTTRLGISYEPVQTKNSSLIFAGELTKILIGFRSEMDSINQDAKSGFTYFYRNTWKGIGSEYTRHSTNKKHAFSIRGGYFSDISGEIEGWTFGFGIKVYGVNLDISRGAPHSFPYETWKISLGYTTEEK
ncbi:MAG: PorV/PorQ family protein [bacterium]|nr:PorV/PorQ family protein [bacterium]